MKYLVSLYSALLLVIILSGASATNAGRFFAVKDDVVETIRQLIGEANQNAVSLPSPQVMAQIKGIIEDEINKFRYLGQKPKYSVDGCASIAELQPCSSSDYHFIDTLSGPIAVWCEMNPDYLLPGGWMRVALVHMANNASRCPSGHETVTTPKIETVCQAWSRCWLFLELPGCAWHQLQQGVRENQGLPIPHSRGILRLFF